MGETGSGIPETEIFERDSLRQIIERLTKMLERRIASSPEDELPAKLLSNLQKLQPFFSNEILDAPLDSKKKSQLTATLNRTMQELQDENLKVTGALLSAIFRQVVK